MENEMRYGIYLEHLKEAEELSENLKSLEILYRVLTRQIEDGKGDNRNVSISVATEGVSHFAHTLDSKSLAPMVALLIAERKEQLLQFGVILPNKRVD